MSQLLHLVNKSPTDRYAFDTCFRMAKSGDAILLIEDAVYAAAANSDFAENVTSRLDDFSFYVLGPDVNARGLGDIPLIEDIKVVDYEGFVDLVADTKATQSWL